MVTEIRISVAMTVYNGERYLKEQLESVLTQLSLSDEVVISDDGSSDGTVEQILQLQQQDERIHFIKGPGRGVKKNVEHAIKNCRGAYVFLADQDDIWKPDKVETVMRAFLEHDAYLVIHDAQVIQGDDTQTICMDSFFHFRKARAGILKNMIKNSYIGCCMAFRRELEEKILPIPNNIEMHDQWIGIVSDFYYGKSVFLWEPLILYRRHGRNQSEMKPYTLGKKIRNKTVFGVQFILRILHIH
ncbi:MAG: glycosyltransferase family 2 protein [Lachnospiraceae bacterium]